MTEIYKSIGGNYVAVLNGEYTTADLEDIITELEGMYREEVSCPLCFFENGYGHKDGCPNAE